MGFTREDKENRKFETDPSDSSKVVVKTKVENQNSDPVPVTIVNPDSNIDLEVTVSPSVTINDSTPIDVNVTTDPVNVNSTIQGTPSVNSTIQNSSLSTKNKLEYTSSDITSLGSSTNVTEWTSALADGVLTKEFVESFSNEHETSILYTHPSLGDGNKALKKMVRYTTQNSATVVESIDYTVVNWDKDSSIQGSVSISAGTITSPNPDSEITQHTVVTTLTITDNTSGGITLSLSGTNASLYHIHEVETGTHSQTSLTYVSGRTYQIHAHSNFSGSSYSHSITVTATGDIYGVSDSVTIATSGTFTGGGAPAFSNDKYLYVDTDGNIGYVESETISRDFTQDFSMSFWCKMAPFDYGYAFSFYFGGRRGSNRDSLNRYDGPQVQYRGHSTNNYILLGSAYTSFADPGLDDNNWHCVVLTYDGSGLSGTDTLNSYNLASRFTLYVDGSEITQSTYFSSPSSFAMSQTMTNFRIGDFVPNNTEHEFNIDEFAYWTTELTSTEAGLIYNSGTVTDLQNTTGLTVPTRYWRYEDNSNLTKDTISDSNQGTIGNHTGGGQQSY